MLGDIRGVKYHCLQCKCQFAIAAKFQNYILGPPNAAPCTVPPGAYAPLHPPSCRHCMYIISSCTLAHRQIMQASHGLWWGATGFKMLIHAHIFRTAILTRIVSHIDLILVCDQGSLIGHAGKLTSLCVKWLRFIPPWLTSRQMSTHTDTLTARQHFEQVIMISSAIWAKNNEKTLLWWWMPSSWRHPDCFTNWLSMIDI